MAKDETIHFEEIHVVKMGKKKIGEIRAEYDLGQGSKVIGGYRYYPKGKDITGAGQRFSSLQACKNSLTAG